MVQPLDTAEAPPRVPPDFPRGVKLLHDPVRNKGTAFTAAERELLGLRGLLPPRVLSQEVQALRVLENLRRKPDDLERYIQLMALEDRNEILFYRVLLDHLEELLPIVYTPTVGKACQLYGHIFRRPRGLFVSIRDRGNIPTLLGNWPHPDVRMIVVTDGERILGLGDLGADGMGIPVGKISLYVACAGLPPTACLPVTLDVGTDNEQLLGDPMYIGLPQPRVRGEAYAGLVEEFLDAVAQVFPDAVVQFEDFATPNAFGLLERYRGTRRVFNDDIQGTAAVVLAGLYSALRLRGGSLADYRCLFFGAGEAAIGAASLLVAALQEAGMPEEEARQRCWFMDRGGLVVQSRLPDLAGHKRPFAHPHPPVASLEEAVRILRPNALLGASATPGAFSRPVLEALLAGDARPVVFSLSNPTSKSECTAEQAYAWTEGRAIFASGSPFPPVVLGRQRLVPGQGNNAYVFPGVGLGVVLSRALRVTDEMFLAAARAIAERVTDADLESGRIFPPLSDIRSVSRHVAAAVFRVAHQQGLARAPLPGNLEEFLAAAQFDPVYPTYA